jgi:hypothetical protein
VVWRGPYLPRLQLTMKFNVHLCRWHVRGFVRQLGRPALVRPVK